MGGLVIDIFVAWLVKLLLRVRRSWGSNRWELIKATIDDSWLSGGRVWNCPTADVAYTYNVKNGTYTGIDSKPFLSQTFAEGHVERFKQGDTILVRVNPLDPRKSALRLADQP